MDVKLVHVMLIRRIMSVAELDLPTAAAPKFLVLLLIFRYLGEDSKCKFADVKT